MNAFRFHHLVFAIAVTVAWFTAEELGLVHAWTGYLAGALILGRLVLGLARMRGFEFRRLVPRFRQPPVGQTGIRHPAVSSTLTLALLLSVIGTAGTGIAMDQGGTLVGKSIRADDGEHEGRGAEGEKRGDDDGDEHEALRAPASLMGLAPAARADDGEDEEGEEGILGEVHETLGNLLLPLVLLHVLYLLVFRFDMARFMLFLPRRRG